MALKSLLLGPGRPQWQMGRGPAQDQGSDNAESDQFIGPTHLQSLLVMQIPIGVPRQPLRQLLAKALLPLW